MHPRFLLLLARLPSQRRHLWRWILSQRRDYMLEEPCPWLTFDAIEFLRRQMRPGLAIFEYGSGGSTLFWLLHRPRMLVSVEHDPVWHAQVRARAGDAGGPDLRLVGPEPLAPGTPGPDPADPRAYASADSPASFRRYVTQIDEFPDRCFDVVLVDGRARTSCIAHAAPKVAKGGWLILDNSARAYYLARNEEALRGFTPRVFAGAVPQTPELSQTTVYTRVD